VGSSGEQGSSRGKASNFLNFNYKTFLKKKKRNKIFVPAARDWAQRERAFPIAFPKQLSKFTGV